MNSRSRGLAKSSNLGGVNTPTPFQVARRTPGDYNGDGRTDQAVFRPSDGVWYINGQPSVQWGISGDIPVPGDYNGDGTTDVAVYRPSNGVWYIKGQPSVQWGVSGDIPVPGDYNGDAITDVAVYRPTNGVWYIKGQPSVQWGVSGDIPVAGDYNGDGTTDKAVFRPSDGTWHINGQPNVQWGVSGDIPVPGDYKGDGITDIAVFRPSDGVWYINGQPSVQWGVSGDIPVPGDYNGDRTTDVALYRPSEGVWYIRNVTTHQWGASGDIPVPLPAAIQMALVPTPTGAIRHVVVVWFENHEYDSVTASSMPYLYGLGQQYGQATGYYAIRHPSMPNYLAFWSGSTQGISTDSPRDLGGPSLSSQLSGAGITWRTYAQDYPTNAGCHTGSTYSGGVDGWGVSGTYVRQHNPAMSFTSVSADPAECAKIQPLAAFDPSVPLSFVVPNLCNDAHDCSLASADDFLKAFLPQVFSSADWAHTMLVVSFDEGSTSNHGGGHVYTMVARSGLSHFSSSKYHDHYGLLRTIESVLGVPCLNSACSSEALTEFLP